MTTLSQEAIKLRDRIRLLVVTSARVKAITKLEQSADEVKSEALALRRWRAHVQLLHDASEGLSLPPLDLPTIDEIGQLQREVPNGTAQPPLDVQETTARLVDLHRRLATATSALRTYFQTEAQQFANKLTSAAGSPHAALHPGLSLECLNAASALLAVIREDVPNPDRLQRALGACQTCLVKVHAPVTTASPQLQAFLAEIAKPAGAPLSRLDARLLEELKATPLADLVTIRLK